MNAGELKTGARLTNRFADLKNQQRAGLVTFITAGDPDIDTSAAILHGLPGAGADIIELGMPFSDPMADGPAIQLANQRALKAGITLPKTLDLVADFRARDAKTPLILMGYYNPIYRYGNRRFIDDALGAGVDGLIIVDLPTEEDDELCHPCMTAGLHWIRLITPTTNDARLQRVLATASGFVYYVSIAGITGTKSAAQSAVKDAVARIGKQTDLPVAVGFGIKTPAQVAQTATVANAVVVGSAVIERIADGIAKQTGKQKITDDVHQFVEELTCGLTTR